MAAAAAAAAFGQEVKNYNVLGHLSRALAVEVDAFITKQKNIEAAQLHLKKQGSGKVKHLALK